MPTFTSIKRNTGERILKTISQSLLCLVATRKNKIGIEKFIEDDPKWRLEQIILNEKVRETVLDVITFCKTRIGLLRNGD